MHLRAAVFTALVVALAGSVVADTLHLKNGSTFDGRVVSETSTSVVFEIRGIGRQTFQKSDIEKIEKGASVFDEYDKRKAATDAEDPDALFELGKWCMESGLRKEGRAAFKTVIRLSPDHKDARTALGYIHADGRWLTRKTYRKFQTKRKAELEKVLGTLKLGRQHKNADDVVCFRPPEGWEKDDSPDGLGLCFLGPELHGVALVIGYEVACPADLELFRKSVRREIESDEEEFELVTRDATSDLGGRPTKASIVRYGPGDARAERSDIFFEREEDVVHVWFICPAEDAAALSGLFAEVRASFTCEGVEKMLKAGELRFELPGDDWRHGWGALADEGDFAMPEFDEKSRVIGHETNLTFISLGSVRGEGDPHGLAKQIMIALFAPQEGMSLTARPGEEWTRKVSDVKVTITPFAGTLMGSIPVDGYAAAFVKGKRVYQILCMNLLGSMGRKYLKKDLNKLLDSLKIG